MAAVAGKIVGGGLPPGGAGIGRGSRRQRKTERCGEPPRIDVAGVAGRWPRYGDKNQHPGVGNGKWKNMEANKKIRNARPQRQHWEEEEEGRAIIMLMPALFMLARRSCCLFML